MRTRSLLVIFLLFFAVSPVSGDNFMAKRNKMVDEQIKDRGVSDLRVLSAMREVERHHFVPKNLQYAAYEDRPLPIGSGQTISQPFVVAVMTEALALSPTDRVLEIGTGSGYQAAILGKIVKEVYTIELLPELARQAQELLEKMGFTNIQVKAGDGYKGWPQAAPFDAIIVTAAPPEVPAALLEQLKVGGRLVIPVGNMGDQRLYLIKRLDSGFEKKEIFPVRFVPLVPAVNPPHPPED